MHVIKELKVFAKDLSVLVVEDDTVLNNELVEILSLFFKEVFYAYDGLEGLSLYEKEAVDIVITDITMPKLSGIEMSKKIKHINDAQAIVVVSAHCHLDFVTEIVDLGIKQFVRKPFDDTEFLYRLLKVSEEIVLLKSLEDVQEESAEKVDLFEQKKENTIETTTHNTVAYTKKLSANSFVNSVEYDVQIEIEYLLSLNEDFERYIDLIYANGFEEEYLIEITSLLKKIYTTISQMPPLLQMSHIIFDLAAFLEGIEFETLSSEQIHQLNVIEYIYEDISKFITVVFIENSVDDIHYLEESLKSSVLQLKQNFLNKTIEDEEDFELF